jgi:hypothetical protein
MYEQLLKKKKYLNGSLNPSINQVKFHNKLCMKNYENLKDSIFTRNQLCEKVSKDPRLTTIGE